MKAARSFRTTSQQARCLLADFDTVLHTCSGLALSGGPALTGPESKAEGRLVQDS